MVTAHGYEHFSVAILLSGAFAVLEHALGGMQQPAARYALYTSGPGSAAPTLVHKGGQQTAQQSAEKIREVQAEGRAGLIKHHLDMLGSLGEFTTSDNQVKLLVDGPATFAAMFADFERAQKSIQMESYIFEDEALGQRVAEVLKRKAAAGVEVRLIYDAVGSLTTSRAFFDDLAQAGVMVCEFNPVRTSFPFRADKLNHRDHRKITLVDSQIAYTGGINVSDVYAAGSSSFLRRKPMDEGGERKRGWRDTSVRLQGAAVTDFSTLYAQTWQRQNCEKPPLPAKRAAMPLAGERLVTVLGSSPQDAEPRIYRALLTAISGAKTSVHMTMSYFVPGRTDGRVSCSGGPAWCGCDLGPSGHERFDAGLARGAVLLRRVAGGLA